MIPAGMNGMAVRGIVRTFSRTGQTLERQSNRSSFGRFQRMAGSPRHLFRPPGSDVRRRNAGGSCPECQDALDWT
jgi:hypothetical protein